MTEKKKKASSAKKKTAKKKTSKKKTTKKKASSKKEEKVLLNKDQSLEELKVKLDTLSRQMNERAIEFENYVRGIAETLGIQAEARIYLNVPNFSEKERENNK